MIQSVARIILFKETLLCLLLLGQAGASAQQSLAIKGGKIIPIVGEPIEDGVVQVAFRATDGRLLGGCRTTGAVNGRWGLHGQAEYHLDFESFPPNGGRYHLSATLTNVRLPVSVSWLWKRRLPAPGPLVT